MQGKKAKHIHISEGMSLYTRDRSPFYWGYINIDGEVFKKSLKTDDKEEAIKNYKRIKDKKNSGVTIFFKRVVSIIDIKSIIIKAREVKKRCFEILLIISVNW